MSVDPTAPSRRSAERALTRRRLLGLLLTTALSLVIGRRGRAGPLDQGIGGTGHSPPTDESDRGIGGTGVIGTIRKFGSIVVNDLRITYPQDAIVRIDGRAASIAALRIGHVVRVTATGPSGALTTRTIDVTREVVGPVETVGAQQLIVLGQTIDTSGLKAGGFRLGDIVAVSGLRRNDGSIVASLVERTPDAPSRVAGPLARGGGGLLKIGGLPVSGLDPKLIGQRVIVEGGRTGSRLVVTHYTTESSLLPSSVRKLSVESYVERRGRALRLGSGFAIEDGGDFDLPAGRSVRAVLQTDIRADGRLVVESVRSGGRLLGRGGGRGPAGRGFGGRGFGGRGFGGPRSHGPNRDGFRRPDGRGPRGPGGGGPGGKGPGGGFGGPGGFWNRNGSRFGGPGGGGFGDSGPAAGGFGGSGARGFGGPAGGGFGGGGPGGFGGGRH